MRDRDENVSVDMIRRVLKNLRAQDCVECLGRDQNAQWRKTGQRGRQVAPSLILARRPWRAARVGPGVAILRLLGR